MDAVQPAWSCPQAYMQLGQCHDGPGNSKKVFQVQILHLHALSWPNTVTFPVCHLTASASVAQALPNAGCSISPCVSGLHLIASNMLGLVEQQATYKLASLLVQVNQAMSAMYSASMPGSENHVMEVVVAIRPLRRVCPGASQLFALFT